MSGDWYRALRRRLPNNLDDSFWEDGPPEESAPSAAESLDRNFYETISSYDSSARLERVLDVRLVGRTAREGRLDSGILRDVLGAINTEIAGAAKSVNLSPAPAFALSAITSGSVVLQLEPLLDEEPTPSDAVAALVGDKVDGLLVKITALHQRAEDEEDLREFAGNDTLLKGLLQLTRALDRHQLNLEMTWRSGDGHHRTSRLTESGRRFVSDQAEPRQRRQLKVVSGRIVQVALDSFKIKTVSERRPLEIQVEGDEGAIDLHLELGEETTIRVEQFEDVNKLGIKTNHRLVFMDYMSGQTEIEYQ